jgi:flagellar basal-body rod protein FlgF
MPVYGEGLPTRVFALTESPTSKFEAGTQVQTGRDLDMAIQGNGWFAVQTTTGEEAYTRDGSMQVSVNGELTDMHGNLLIGESGPIILPLPYDTLTISEDGTITTRPIGAPANVQEEVGRLKFVNPPNNQLTRGTDGLFRSKNGQEFPADPLVSVRTGVLEGSNVNAVEEMVNMISLQRHYELQVKMMKQADELDTRSNSLLRII